MLGKAIPKQTNGMCTANDSACICRAWSRCSCSTGVSAAAQSWDASTWDIGGAHSLSARRCPQDCAQSLMPPSTESVAPVTNELDDDDLGALGGEQPRGRRADAATAARDQRH